MVQNKFKGKKMWQVGLARLAAIGFSRAYCTCPLSSQFRNSFCHPEHVENPVSENLRLMGSLDASDLAGNQFRVISRSSSDIGSAIAYLVLSFFLLPNYPDLLNVHITPGKSLAASLDLAG